MLNVRAGDQWMAKQWEEWMFPGLLANLISEDSLVFDIGANIGKMSLAYLSLGARVVAVEPQSACIQELRTRFADNDRIQIVHAACGQEEGSAVITTYGNGGTISTFVPDYYWGSGGPWARTPHDGKETVDMTTLDALIEMWGEPDFIKIDVEGYEYEVLMGLHQFVPLSFEFHPYFAPRAKLCIRRVLEIEPEAEFNYTQGEALAYSLSESADEERMGIVIDALMMQHGKNYFGNIYARKAT
jgi:FkbM family methyltransferase